MAGYDRMFWTDPESFELPRHVRILEEQIGGLAGIGGEVVKLAGWLRCNIGRAKVASGPCS